MADITQDEAKGLIEQIRSEYTLDRTKVGNRIQLLVSNGLEILSNQLYEKSTHFILEIIQNADDNSYNTPIPTLNFSYKPSSFRIDCNEEGFTKSNVEAICAINQSTKSNKQNDGEYIGEKGIGFKSVFKAADVIWISSRNFTFNFDKTKFLGMVTPLWAEFPEETKLGWTSMYLNLSKTFEEETLIHDLLAFDANLLIFLRRIKEINIHVEGIGNDKKQRISKSETQDGQDTLTTIWVGDTTVRYLIREQVVENLPQEKRRLNWRRTKILLGFPVAEGVEQSQLAGQNVYAFLPIRNYGLRFLLQGDFILTASREDIESTLPWNRRLREAVVEAFLDAVEHFNLGKMKYTWPWYLPDGLPTPNSFFDVAMKSILNILRELPVLESCAGTMEKAKSLKSVHSQWFRDENGVPFTLSSRTANKYLSSNYPPWAIDGTASIGVSELSSQEFLDDLNTLIREDPQAISAKSAQWHIQLAISLFRLTMDVALLSIMQDINLIPLQDGNWTSARRKSLFFSKGQSSLEIPSGLDILVVDPIAGADPNRHRLFMSLGVKAWEAPEICQLILQQHSSAEFDAKSLTMDQLISHAAFLYKSSWQPPKDANLWFITKSERPCLGREVYIAATVAPDSAASRVFIKLQQKFPVIHNDYFEAFPEDAEWSHWLVENLGLSMIPRLITPLIEPKPQIMLRSDMADSTAEDKNEGLSKKLGLQDYQMQRMLLEQQNKKRLLMARQEQDALESQATNKVTTQERHDPLNDFDFDAFLDAPAENPNSGARFPPNMNSIPVIDSEVPTQFVRAQQTEPQRLQQVQQQQQQPQRYMAYQQDMRQQPQTGQQMMMMTPQQQQAMQQKQRAMQQQAMQQQQRAQQQQAHQMIMNARQPMNFQTQAHSSYQRYSIACGQEATATSGDSATKSQQRGNQTPKQGNDKTSRTIFDISDEFMFMFRECQSSDVLQVLRDNWHHYSQWIDGAHMQWQDSDFLYSSIQLNEKIASFSVMTAMGKKPLQETVLPSVDRQLDQEYITPSIQIIEPGHKDWRLLGCFGVLQNASAEYYLRCLQAISEQKRPNVDLVTYVYDKIQAFYRGNETLINAAFFEQDVVLIAAKTSLSPTLNSWINMIKCLAQNITIENQYPSSSYLFRCLRSPSGDPITPLIAAATLISSTSSVDDVSRLFRKISKALKDVTPLQATQLLQPLWKRAVFPVTPVAESHANHRFLSLADESWFIADRPSMRKSFRGKVPLLAFSASEVASLTDLLRGLRLNNRLLSQLVTDSTRPVGQVRIHWVWTSTLRMKRPFLRALIPVLHNSRVTVMNQIDNIRGNVVPSISLMYTLFTKGEAVEGRSIDGQSTLSLVGNSLNLYLTEESAAAEHPPYELSILLADKLEIKDPNHRSLLHTVLMNSSIENLYSTFTQQGMDLDGVVLVNPMSPYKAQRKDLMRIPSPFWRFASHNRGLDGALDVLRYGQSPWRKDISLHEDRRLPMEKLMEFDRSLLEDMRAIPEELRGWEHLQHLGEHLTSKLLQHHLGKLYDPDRDWTSELRCQSGFKDFEGSSCHAAFTLTGIGIAQKMKNLIKSYGRFDSTDCQTNLQKHSPTYHLDVVVNTGGKDSSFVLKTSQLQRIRQLGKSGTNGESSMNIALLLKINDAYSSDACSAELIVDPWRFFCSSKLRLEGDWVTRGNFVDETSEHPNKRRKLSALAVPWRAQATLGASTRRSISLSNRQPFVYRALQPEQIRLANILPGDPLDPLCAILLHVPLKSTPPYRALSYVWGTGRKTKEISTPDGHIQITSSLDKALRNLRRKDESIILWVDAVCIDQNNGKEKAGQIRLLPQLFSNASLTYAFLEGNEASSAALEMLMQVRAKAATEERSRRKKSSELKSNATCNTEIQQEFDSADYTCEEDQAKSFEGEEEEEGEEEDWPHYLRKVPSSWSDRPIPHLNDKIWISVKGFFTLPFFRRVWIIQEVIAAFRVMVICGHWTIDWSDLHLAVDIVNRQIQLCGDDTTQLRMSWEPFLALAGQREWEARHHRWSLIMLLEHFRYAESTLCRDRYFAILGLAGDGNEEDFEPDYDSPLEDIVLRFARVFVRQGRGMQLLYRAGLRAGFSRFPSWIPDWTVQTPVSLADASRGSGEFEASGPQQPSIECAHKTDELLVEGFEVDIITKISSSSNVEEGLASYLDEIDGMIDSTVLYPVRDSCADLKWKVPIAGVAISTVTSSDDTDLRASYIALRNWLDIKGKKKSIVNAAGPASHGITHVEAYKSDLEIMAASSYRNQAKAYLVALRGTVLGWKFVVTKRGYLGTVPNLGKVGDVVAIMKGGAVPFLLQKSTTRTGAFRVVGECYVHGIMNGEGISLPDVVETRFTLH